MSGLWQPHQRDDRGLFERNAGKLLIGAFAIGVPLNFVGLSADMGMFVLLGRAAFGVLLIMSIIGYIQRSGK